MSKEVSKKRKLISYWLLGILTVGILLFSAFDYVTGKSRSVGDDAFTPEQEEAMRKELRRQGLPTSQTEAREREYQRQYNINTMQENEND